MNRLSTVAKLGHFWVGLCLDQQVFMPNPVYENMFPVQVYFMEIKLLSMWKVLHEELFWYRGKDNLKMASWPEIKQSLICVQQNLVMVNIISTRIKYCVALLDHSLVSTYW